MKCSAASKGVSLWQNGSNTTSRGVSLWRNGSRSSVAKQRQCLSRRTRFLGGQGLQKVLRYCWVSTSSVKRLFLRVARPREWLRARLLFAETPRQAPGRFLFPNLPGRFLSAGKILIPRSCLGAQAPESRAALTTPPSPRRSPARGTRSGSGGTTR